MLAIIDGINGNTAGKIKERKALSEKLARFDNMEGNLVRNLRNFWVKASSEWMAGHNESKQNFKVFFGYTDLEWDYIWN